MSLPSHFPRWVRELDRLSSVKSQLFFYGNVKDSLLYPTGPDSWEIGPLREALFTMLQAMGYSVVGAYDAVDGMTFADARSDGEMSKRYDEVLQAARKEGPQGQPQPSVQGRKQEDPVDLVIQQMRTCLANRQHACAFVLEFTTQLIQGPDQLGPTERQMLLRMLKASQESRRVQPKDAKRPLQNMLIVVCDRLTDLPTWLYLENPYAGSVEIERPKLAERERFFELFLKSENYEANDLADLTDGMSYRDLMGVRAVSGHRDAPKGAKHLVDLYRFGVRETQWDALDFEKLASAEEALGKRVLGQPAAVNAVCDMLRRARLHLSGAQHSSRSKPRGVLFFAGPTGVGKTEMAKAIASLVFGTDEACVRFDMSEYGQPHSDQRLLGAPPGYVGYEEGGQLTNRVKSNPFSVLLFDEIEKAHPSVLDKFLQILEDGRMTDGRGETVYFNEAVIVFTSNAGIYQLDTTTGRPAVDPITGRPLMNVNPEDDQDYVAIREKVTNGVHQYFKHFLGRPELLNRIGQNVVVFDFVRPPVMRQILERKVLPSITSQIRERWQLEVLFSTTVIDQLMESATADPSSGGRGVGNLVEVAIVNPLSRALFDLMVDGHSLRGETLIVQEVRPPSDENGHRYELRWELHERPHATTEPAAAEGIEELSADGQSADGALTKRSLEPARVVGAAE